MKKILLLLATAILIGLTNESNAQACTFGNLGVKINNISPGTIPGTCVVNFDFYFDIEHNQGGKYFYIHIWPTNLYSQFNYSKPPTTSILNNGNGALDNSIISFGYYHFQSALSPLSTYSPDPANVPGFQTGYTLSETQGTPDRYIAHNLVITLPQGCNISQSLTADAWESQSDHAQTVACFSTNQKFYLNDPSIVNGLLFCQIPRRYKFDLTTLSSTNKTVNYQVRIDNGDGMYNATSDTMIIKSGTEIITSTTPYQSGIQDYLPYSNTKPYSDMALWVLILKNGVDIPNDVYARIDNTCIPLPVSFYSFSAVRKNNNVILKWTTVSEINNKGFEVQRKIGYSDWQVAGFVNSLAVMGNSTERLDYSYEELNTEKGISEYRLRQVDIDEKSTFSPVRPVNGLEQKDKVMVFPNPSANGQFTIVLNGNEKGADLKLIDMSGRAIRSWVLGSGDRLNVAGVPAGPYILKVIFRDSQETKNVKVMVSN